MEQGASPARRWFPRAPGTVKESTRARGEGHSTQAMAHGVGIHGPAWQRAGRPRIPFSGLVASDRSDYDGRCKVHSHGAWLPIGSRRTEGGSAGVRPFELMKPPAAPGTDTGST